MIGVIANPADHAVVSEFFELFKTPWELYQSDRSYEVLLCAAPNIHFDEGAAKLVLVYSGHELKFDAQGKISQRSNTTLSYKGSRIPIYGNSVTFREKGTGILLDEESQGSGMHQQQFKESVVVRIGYDLFDEIRT